MFSLALSETQDRPTSLVFDLDPGEGADILNCARVALWIREKFVAFKLQSFVKTSGSKGLQLYVPLNTAVTFEQTKKTARELGRILETEHPDAVVTKMLKALRKNKVLIDWSQNDQHKTTVSVYSVRATKVPSVSVPLHWEEVEELIKSGKVESVRFTPQQAVNRVKTEGDIFAPLLTLKQELPEIVYAPADGVASRTTSRARLSSRKPRKTG